MTATVAVLAVILSKAAAPTAVLSETTDPEEQKALISSALPIAGLFVLVLLVAVFFLWRSMNHQMGKIDPSLPEGPDDKQQALDRRLTEEAEERGAGQDDGGSR